MRVALEHHATGGQGYPTLPPGWKPGVLSQIVAVADCYVSLQSRIGEDSAPVSPSEALGLMLGPLSARFAPAMLWALVRSVGFYPAGQIVEMDDGAIAVVLAPNAADMARPHVRLVMAWNGAPLAPVPRRRTQRDVRSTGSPTPLGAHVAPRRTGCSGVVMPTRPGASSVE